MISNVMQNLHEVVRTRSRSQLFWGLPPVGGVRALTNRPVFYEDKSGLAWSSCLAYGSQLNFGPLGIPTGFEWSLGLMELMLFQLVWRFQGSAYVGMAMAFTFNR